MQQGIGGSTLLTVPVKTGSNPFGSNCGFVLGGKSYNNDMLRPPPLSKLPRDRKSVHSGHINVQQCDLRRPDADSGSDRPPTQNESGVVTRYSKQRSDRFSAGLIIVYDE